MLKSLVKRFLKDESGQSMTEYILILSVVVLIVVRFRKTITERIMTATDKVGQQIESVTEPTE